MMVECFCDDLSAPAAAKKADVNPKTAYEHYDEIIEQYKREKMKNFYERYEKVRVQIIASLDKDIEDVNNLLREIRDEKITYIKAKKLVPNYLTRNELEALRFRLEVKDRKSRYTLTPTPAEEDKLEESGDD